MQIQKYAREHWTHETYNKMTERSQSQIQGKMHKKAKARNLLQAGNEPKKAQTTDKPREEKKHKVHKTFQKLIQASFLGPNHRKQRYYVRDL